MNRWICLAAAAALVLAGCDEDGKPSRSGGPSSPAFSAADPVMGYAAAPELLPQARATADALIGPAGETGEDGGRRFFDGQSLRRAGFAVPDEASPVYVSARSGRRLPLLTTRKGGIPKVSDLGRGVPSPGSGADETRPNLLAGAAGTVLAQFIAFESRCYAEVFPGLSRADWGASRRRGAAVAMRPTHVTVHHTQGPQTMSASATAAAVRNIQAYHMADTDGRHGWDDIGYHFLIDGMGRVAEGRPAETLGAHAGGANDDNIGISMMGDFNRVKPTDAQVESLTRLVSFLAIKYRQDPSRKGFLEPHRHYDQTDCPGKNMMSILDTLRERIDAHTSDLVTRMAKASPGQFVPAALTDA